MRAWSTSPTCGRPLARSTRCRSPALMPWPMRTRSPRPGKPRSRIWPGSSSNSCSVTKDSGCCVTRDSTLRSGLRSPRLLWIPAAAGLALIVLPVAGLLFRVDFARLPELLTSQASLDALELSLVTAGLSTLLCVLLGVPLAVVLARVRRGGRVLRAVVVLPLVMPPVVGGLALLYLDRKSTRLNSSHVKISYAVFCL